MSNPVLLKSPEGRLEAVVDLNGGMLAQLYLCAGGQRKALLHKAPWLKDDYYSSPAGLMEHLSGEWACVPFGFVTQDCSLFSASAPHGLPCHSTWQLRQVNSYGNSAVLTYDYPEGNDLAHIERTVTLRDDSVVLSFTVTSRKDCAAPMGVHPVFPTEGEENVLELSIAGDGIVYGIECEAGISRLVPGARFDALNRLPLQDKYHGADGNTEVMDGTRLPKAYHTEEIVQMLHPQGQAVLTYPNKGVRLTLNWDKEVIPTCLLWMSNYGRKYEPWNGTNCCLGIEPIAGAWDLAAQSVAEHNAVKDAGVPTTVPLKAGQGLTFNYSIAVEEL